MITGSESPKKKHENKMSFIRGESKVLIVSLGSGGGMDGLQGVCDRVVFGELDWSPSIHKQAIGRLHRPGQEKQVFAYFLHTAVGSDPRMMDVLDVKRQQNDQVVNPDEALFTPATDSNSRIRELAADFLAARGDNLDEDHHAEPEDHELLELSDEQLNAWDSFESLCGLVNDLEIGGESVDWARPVSTYVKAYGWSGTDIETVRAYMNATGLPEAQLRQHFDDLQERAA
jgi:superfamily II DNA or RNA helicase